MKRICELTVAAALMSPCAAAGDEGASIVAARNVPPGAILAEQDLRIVGGDDASIIFAAVVGKETKRLIPEGAGVRESDVRAPTLVARNGLVRMEFTKGPLMMSTEGRALSGGAAGEIVKVMNIRSKTVVSAIVVAPGKVLVQ
ncbi:MAG: flagellar basal body P-ring formation chaperone FlgA [Pseudomonadota bacterium]